MNARSCALFGIGLVIVGVALIIMLPAFTNDPVEFELISPMINRTGCRGVYVGTNTSCYSVHTQVCSGLHYGYRNGDECVIGNYRVRMVLGAVLFTLGIWTFLGSVGYLILRNGVRIERI
jgi:hypothetical protein